jgi:hypothetical protein
MTPRLGSKVSRRANVSIAAFLISSSGPCRLEVASRSKDDFVRVATTEMRAWLDRLDLQSELGRALAKMVVEVKAEIRFHPRADGKLEPETRSEIKVKPLAKT